jgi:hypothetical protein
VNGLALAGILAVIVPIAAHANGPSMRPVNEGPSPGIVLAWDGGGSSRNARTIGDHPTTGHMHQWNGGWMSPHWGPHRFKGVWCPCGRPTYWVWGPSGGAFDYPDLLGQWP